MPVRVTMPMMKPTQAQATATDTERCAPRISPSMMSRKLIRVVFRSWATTTVETMPQKPEKTAE